MDDRAARKYRRMRFVHKLMNLTTLPRLRRTRTRRYALVETTGRRTGQPRQTPVSYERDGSTVWIVAVHGDNADYVKNLRREPKVRIRIGGEWHDGVAEILEGDDVAVRTRMWNRADRLYARLLSSELLTIKVTLRT